jgi:hypothetical protein
MVTAVKACAASIAILLCAYTAVGVITDRSRLQQQLTEQAAALEAAQSAIHELQAAKSNMLEDRQMPRRFFAERRFGKRVRRQHHEDPPDVEDGLLPPPPPTAQPPAADAATIRAAAVITDQKCRASWLDERQRAAAEKPPSPHALPFPFAGGDLEAPSVLEAALAARAPDKEASAERSHAHTRAARNPSAHARTRAHAPMYIQASDGHTGGALAPSLRKKSSRPISWPDQMR